MKMIPSSLAAGFTQKESPLSLYSPAVTRKVAVGANDAVAGDGDCQGVGRAGTGDRADCGGQADLSGDLRVTRCCARRDFLKSLPNLLLEGGASDVEREVDLTLWRFDQADDLGHELVIGSVRPDELSLRKALLEIGCEFVRIVAERDGADAFFRRRDEDRSKRALSDRKANGLPFAMGAEPGGRHPEDAIGFLIKPTAGIEARFVKGIGDRGALPEFVAQTTGAMGLEVGFGGDAGVLLEESLEMKTAKAG